MSPAAYAAGKKPPKDAVTSTVARGRTITFGFIPALDGLRALAVLGVMMYHGGSLFSGVGSSPSTYSSSFRDF
jgi:peptidoglycan/LPS O-acetylase OafA/YrhL